MNATRMILEYGLEFLRSADGGWTLTTGYSANERVAPERVVRECGLRPVVVWIDSSTSPGRSYVLPAQFTFAEIERAPRCLSQIFDAEGPSLFPAFNFLYYVRAITSRLRSLAILYAQKARACLETHVATGQPVATWLVPGAEELAFEVEALITASIRFRDALRVPFWRRFGGDAEVPKGWHEVFARATLLPDDLIAELKESNDAWLAQLNLYRNSIEHHAPVCGPHPHVEAIAFPGVGLGCSLSLPCIGSAGTAKRGSTDAMTYCWQAATSLVNVSRRILHAASEYPSPHPYPEEL